MGEFLHKSRQGSNNHQNFHQSQQTQLKPLENKTEAKPEEEVSYETPEAVFQRKWDSFGGDDESEHWHWEYRPIDVLIYGYKSPNVII